LKIASEWVTEDVPAYGAYLDECNALSPVEKLKLYIDVVHPELAHIN
jgi:hypothetical protein